MRITSRVQMNKKRMEKKRRGEYLLYIYLKTTQGKKCCPK